MEIGQKTFVSILILLLATLARAQTVTVGIFETHHQEISTFVHLLDFSKLSSTVLKYQKVTILAPSNTAFRLAAHSIGCLDTSTEQSVLTCLKSQGKKRVQTLVKNHIILDLDQSWATPNNDSVTLLGTAVSAKHLEQIQGNIIFSHYDREAAGVHSQFVNTIVHIISNVLFPDVRSDSAPKASLRKMLEATSKFRILLAILEKMGTIDMLESNKNQTLFAPTDYGFRMSARDIGCVRYKSDEDVVKCLTGEISSRFLPLPFQWQYHVIPRTLYLSEMLYFHVLNMANNVPVYRKGIYFIDQVPTVQNARLNVGLYDLPYENGVVHAIHRIMLPFSSAPVPDPCDFFEYPLSVANGSFVPIYMLTRDVAICEGLRNAIFQCKMDKHEVCRSGRGAHIIIEDITVGRAISAAKKCKSVFKSLEACGRFKALV